MQHFIDNRGVIAARSHAQERYHSSRGAARKILALLPPLALQEAPRAHVARLRARVFMLSLHPRLTVSQPS